MEFNQNKFLNNSRNCKDFESMVMIYGNIGKFYFLINKYIKNMGYFQISWSWDFPKKISVLSFLKCLFHFYIEILNPVHRSPELTLWFVLLCHHLFHVFRCVIFFRWDGSLFFYLMSILKIMLSMVSVGLLWPLLVE